MSSLRFVVDQALQLGVAVGQHLRDLARALE
jgi:hypothetical protein